MIDIYGEEAYGPLGVNKARFNARQTQLDKRLSKLVDLIEQTPEEKQEDLIDLIEGFLRLAGFRKEK
jgi:hypothetical protein